MKEIESWEDESGVEPQLVRMEGWHVGDEWEVRLGGGG